MSTTATRRHGEMITADGDRSAVADWFTDVHAVTMRNLTRLKRSPDVIGFALEMVVQAGQDVGDQVVERLPRRAMDGYPARRQRTGQ